MLIGKMKKNYLLLHKHRKLMSKHENSLDLDKLNNSELKMFTSWCARSRDNPIPSTNVTLMNRVSDTKHRGEIALFIFLLTLALTRINGPT